MNCYSFSAPIWCCCADYIRVLRLCCIRTCDIAKISRVCLRVHRVLFASCTVLPKADIKFARDPLNCIFMELFKISTSRVLSCIEHVYRVQQSMNFCEKRLQSYICRPSFNQLTSCSLIGKPSSC